MAQSPITLRPLIGPAQRRAQVGVMLDVQPVQSRYLLRPCQVWLNLLRKRQAPGETPVSHHA
jgi:hypothetical protein